MPLTNYFNRPGNGKPSDGPAVMASMQRRYGAKAGKSVFYATVNKMRKGTPAQRAAQPRQPGGRKVKDSTHQTAAKRLRRVSMARGNAQRAEVESRHPFRNESKRAGKLTPGAPSALPKGK